MVFTLCKIALYTSHNSIISTFLKKKSKIFCRFKKSLYFCNNKYENVYCCAESVPSTGDYVFKGMDIANVTLHVPASAIEAYKTIAPWSGFGTIKAIEETEGIESVKDRGIAIQSAGGFINISGLDNNEKVSFYGIDGKALGSATAINGTTSFAAQSGSIVVAKIGKESIKVSVK